MAVFSRPISLLLTQCLFAFVLAGSKSPFEVILPVPGKTSQCESDTAAAFYPSKDKYAPLFVGNDGSAETGGFRLWDLYKGTPAPKQLQTFATGRSKLVEVVYSVGKDEKDLIVTLSMQDGLIRLYEIDEEKSKLKYLSGADKTIRGDFSAMCSWKSDKTGYQYLYVMGKRWVHGYIIRESEKKRARKGEVEIVESQAFALPIEPNSCTINTDGKVYFGGSSGKLYSFQAADSTAVPTITELGEPVGDDEINGLGFYNGKKDSENYLFITIEDSLHVFDPKKLSKPLAVAKFDDEELEVSDFTLYQKGSKSHPHGTLIFAGEGDNDSAFFVTSSLSGLFKSPSPLKSNTKYDPRDDIIDDAEPKECSKLSECYHSGYCPSKSGKSCDCFPGFSGSTCNKITCPDNCGGASRGTCTGPNTCVCKGLWTGESCSTLKVLPVYETEETGGVDGDDPAIWIHPTDKTKSRIITTIKSEVGSGLGVFDLTGKQTGGTSGGEPNNVDVIYSFDFNGRSIDLAVAACRDEQTLCMHEITTNGSLVEIAGGVHPMPQEVLDLEEDFEVYGSCVFHSPNDGKDYVFINSKTSLYLQFLLGTSGDSLTATLVRHFYGGNGGQVEGCVVDDPNARLILGEEPYGLWSYPAEPTSPATGTLIDNTVVDGGRLHADVEGVTIVYGKTPSEGYIIVSCQGFSEYNVYKRAAPYDYVMTFTIGDNTSRGVDRVTNTDGVTAVGVSLGPEFPYGMLVVHDDVNEGEGGVAKSSATFKIVSLKDVLGQGGLLGEVDTEWDPRAN